MDRIKCNRVGGVHLDLHVAMDDVRVLLYLREAMKDLMRDLDDVVRGKISNGVMPERLLEDEYVVVWTADQHIVAPRSGNNVVLGEKKTGQRRDAFVRIDETVKRRHRYCKAGKLVGDGAVCRNAERADRAARGDLVVKSESMSG